MQVDDLGLRKLLFQRGDVRIADLVWTFREFLRVLKRSFFLFAEAAVVAGLQGFPIFRSKYSLRRSEMVLGSIMAVVQQGDPQVGSLIQLAVERTAHAGVEAGKTLQGFRTVRHCFVHVSGFPVQDFLVYFFYFRRGVPGFNVAYSWHESSLRKSFL